MTDRISYRAPEIARMLGVSRSLVYEWMDSGILPSVQVNGTRLILRVELDAFLTRHTKRKGA